MSKKSKIPERERWLFENPEALKMVRKGLRESAAGRLVRAKYSFVERVKGY